MNDSGVGTFAERPSVASKVCRVAFCIYVVFMLVGSAVPFQDPEPGDDVAASNPINQVVDSVIPLVCLVCLWPKKRQAIEILKQEKYLALFLVWCAMSVVWSEAPLMSAKAGVRIAGSTIVALSFLVNARSSEDALKYIRGVLTIYIPLTFLAIALVPGATQWEFPAWRGLARHKNTLGEIALVSTLVWVSGMYGSPLKRKLWCGLFAAASLALVIGSKSTTSLMTLAFIASIGLWLMVARRMGPALTSAAAAFCGVCALLVFLNGTGMAGVFANLGKDDTFTGRTDLWEAIIDEAKTHPVLGSGFGGFWTPDRDLGLYAPTESAWQPNEGHEGYLDLLNETGVIGLCLLAAIVIAYLAKAGRWGDGRSLWKLLFIAVLIVNSMESTLFRAGSFTGWVFILAYLGFHADLMRVGAGSDQFSIPNSQLSSEKTGCIQ